MRANPYSEFLGQILPLFIPLVLIPLLIAIGYGIYKFNKASKNPDAFANSFAAKMLTTLRATFNPDSASNRVHPLAMGAINPTNDSHNVEESPMLKRNRPESDENKPSTRSKIDTGDLPPLDMLLGEEDETDIEEIAEPPAPTQKPVQTVQLRQMTHSTQYVKLNTGDIAPAKEVLSILRDEDDGRLIIQINDTAYRTMANAGEIKQEFTRIMKELAAIVAKEDDNPPARDNYVVGTVVEAQSANIRDLIDSKPEAEIKAPPRPAVKSVPPPPTADGLMPGDLPSYKLSDNPVRVEKKGRFGGQKVELDPIPQLDLAAAIETYLQYKLQHTPEYRRRKIHIHGTPTGSIRIQVDEQYYDFVDEVKDLEVRSFLQATIAEWQERQ